ncbi:phosphomannomutase [Yersinia enterocolitica]|nr:phosphomannomutase [Yersinia enterocolitica]
MGLLAEAFLKKESGAKIVHDPRLTWNTIDIVERSGGIPIMSKTGHAFIKERMRKEDAIYGGEMSAHHYFRDFAYCDSGMIPWLLIAELISINNIKISNLINDRIFLYPCSGEVNYEVECSEEILKRLENLSTATAKAIKIEYIDGLSVEFEDFRFNVRISNTESLLRVNLETKGDTKLLISEFDRIDKEIRSSN